MDGIVNIQLEILEHRLQGRDIALDLNEAAKTWLADQGYDPVYGARPLKRVIQKAVQNPLAELLLSGNVLNGSTVIISADDNGLVINGIGRVPKVPVDGPVH
jgi:ATP-dependent Clp protease ATP-binding subunit ClpB